MIKYLDSGELKNFFEVAKRNPRDSAIFSLIFRLGLRVSECTQIRLEDLKPYPSRPVQIYIRRAKNGISREYPISFQDAKAIKKWLKLRERIKGHEDNPYLFITRLSLNHHITNTAVQRLFIRLAEEAGLPVEKRFVHSLRHSCAVSLLSGGQDIYFVKEFLGHKSLQSTMSYASIMPSGWASRSFLAVESLASI